MNIVVTGGTGFLGRPLVERLLAEGHRVAVLTRNPSSSGDRVAGNLVVERWDGVNVDRWAHRVDGADAVINLAGDSIGGKRWTPRQKQAILDSRVDATRAVVKAISQANTKPAVLVSVSAVGYYGHVESGDVTESHPCGSDFLANVCARWEDESRKAEAYGVRVVNPRFGVILARDGGALQRFLLPFSLFIGGPLGPGTQWFPWIHHDDAISLFLFLIQTDSMAGPVNAAAPNPATMKDFCSALGKALRRPSWAPVPSFVLRALLGEMSSIVLTGQRVVPKKLLQSGYAFRYPELDLALNAILS